MVFEKTFQSRHYTRCSTAVHRRTLARSLTLPTFQVAEDFALPAATASSSLRFTAPLLAAEYFRSLALRCGTACHRRLRRHRLWRPSALESRRFCSLHMAVWLTVKSVGTGLDGLYVTPKRRFSCSMQLTAL